jgi:hypothetical protein
MRQKLRSPAKINRPSRRQGADIPAAVPTFEAPAKAIPPPPPATEDDQSDEAVRRMVEAAYT